MKRNEKTKKMLPGFKPGDIVEHQGGMLYYFTDWVQENRYCDSQKYFNDKIRGVVLNSRASGPMYRIVEIGGEQFEIMQASLQKVS